MLLVNFGCGDNYHPDWENFDLYPNSRLVKKFDIRKRLPFDDSSVDVCYSSHLLEHLSWPESDNFIKEQFRILKKGGIVRIVVPDLEVICKNYLFYLDDAFNGNEASIFKYDYSYLEMFDQTTRTKTGGELGKLWRTTKIEDINLEFMFARHGCEVKKAIGAYEKNKGKSKTFKKTIKRILKIRTWLTELFIWLLNGTEHVSFFREGCFRNSGEIHKIMYDRFSLKRILTRNSFNEFSIKNATESQIPNFSKYQLDFKEGQTIKPDSLFIEAKKV